VVGKSVGSRLFDIGNYLFLGLVSLGTLLPFVYIIAGSFADSEEMLSNSMVLFPTSSRWRGTVHLLDLDIPERDRHGPTSAVGTLINWC